VRFWTLEEATDAMPRVAELVARIQSLLGEVRSAPTPLAPTRGNGRRSPNGSRTPPGSRKARHELEGLLRELANDDVILRDPDRELIDFPSKSPSGQTYLLCWLVDEDAIEWWHWPDDGFAGRTPLTEPPP
jgi:hypothetical protein